MRTSIQALKEDLARSEARSAGLRRALAILDVTLHGGRGVAKPATARRWEKVRRLYKQGLVGECSLAALSQHELKLRHK